MVKDSVEGYMLYVNENFARVRAELSHDGEPSFSSTAKERLN